MIRTLLAILLTPFFYIAVYLAVFVLGTIYIITFPIPAKYMQWYIRICCRIVLLCCGQWLRIEGKAPKPEDGPYLYLPNHESALDAFMIGACIPEYFGIVAAEYNFTILFWSSIARRFGAVPIERKNLTEAKNSLRQLEQFIKPEGELEAKNSALIFPEGTRTLDGHLQPMKKGAFHVAINTGAVIVFCGIRNAYEHYNRNTWLIRPGIITWVWGEPQHEVANYYRDHVSKMNDDEKKQLVNELAQWGFDKLRVLTGEKENDYGN